MELTKEEKELVEKNKKYILLLEKYTDEASPYPTVEEFCLLNNIELNDLKHWQLLDAELKRAVHFLHLKAYHTLEKFLIVDTTNVSFGGDKKKYKIDKKGVLLKLKELKEILKVV
jgi:hypothetical protein